MNRRHFFQTMATGASAVAAGAAPSDRVNLAVIGVRGQGRWLAGRFAAQPDVRIAALCGAGALAAVQREPLPLQLALALEFRNRRCGQRRRPSNGFGPLGAGRRLSSGGVGYGP
jgi:hypothetical protein